MDEKAIDKLFSLFESCSPSTLIVLFSLKMWESENLKAELDTAIDYLTNVKKKIDKLVADKDCFSGYAAQRFIELFEAKLWEEQKPLSELDFAIDTLIRFKTEHQKRLEGLENERRAN